jgi:hypothetical protein
MRPAWTARSLICRASSSFGKLVIGILAGAFMTKRFGGRFQAELRRLRRILIDRPEEGVGIACERLGARV